MISLALKTQFNIFTCYVCVVFPQVLAEQASDRRLSEQNPSGLLRSCVADPGEDPERYHGGWDSPAAGMYPLHLTLLQDKCWLNVTLCIALQTAVL